MIRRLLAILLILGFIYLIMVVMVDQPKIQIAESLSADQASSHFPQVKSQLQPQLKKVRAPSDAALTAITDLKSLQAKYPGPWVFHQDSLLNIKSMMGGVIPKGVLNAGKAQAVASELAPLLGARASDLHLRSSEAQETPLARIYRFDQIIDGYPVYQGELTLIGRQQDGDLFMVNSNVRDLKYDGRQIVITSDKAKSLIENDETLNASNVTLAKNQSVLYESHPGESELAWVFTTELSNENQKGTYEVLVSAVTGKVLYTEAHSIK